MTNPVTLEGMNVFITGAGQGIGESVAQVAFELGANLTLIDVNEATLSTVAKRFSSDRVLALKGSVTDPDFVQSAVEHSVARYGAINGLVNNAGIVRAAMIEKMTLDQWHQSIDVNLTGVFLCLQAVGRHMIERRKAGSRERASIVNISSDAGRRGTIGQINYGATKAGVFAMSMSAAREWARYDVTVNTVAPGGVIVTPMTETIRGEKFREKTLEMVPLGRFGQVEEVSWPICFLLTPAASFITGQSLNVNGGFHMNVG